LNSKFQLYAQVCILVYIWTFYDRT
jgi:hypothetical protein